MSGAIQAVTLIVLLALIALVIYLIVAVIRLKYLLEDTRKQVNDNLSPLLMESRQVMSNVNQISGNIASISNALGRAADAVEGGIEQWKAKPPGEKLGFRIMKEIVTRLAGLRKAASAMKGEEEEHVP